MSNPRGREGVALAVEITSSKPQADHKGKRRCYARGGIPLGLLVDREAALVTLFSDSENDDYPQHCTVPFGKPFRYPHPSPLAWRPRTWSACPRASGYDGQHGRRAGWTAAWRSLDLPEERPGSTGQGGG
jgi:hypothetical protein